MAIDGRLTYEKWGFMVDWPMKNGDLWSIDLSKMVIYGRFTYEKWWFVVALPIENGDGNSMK